MSEEESGPGDDGVTLAVSRPAYTQSRFEELYPRQPTKKTSFLTGLRQKCQCSALCVGQTLLSKLPVINTMRNYQWKSWLVNDLIAGISIGVIHIPQGMGFSMLTSLPPVYGLYSSLFPVVLYFLFGTSHHISMGTMAITSLMIAAIVDQQVELLGLPAGSLISGPAAAGDDATSNMTAAPEVPQTTMAYSVDTVQYIDILNNNNNSSDDDGGAAGVSPLSIDLEKFKVDIATSVTLMMGLWQIGLSLLNLGVVATFMSMTFIGGFLTGCAGHIVTSQVPSVLGISIKRPSGTFSLPMTWYEILRNIPNVNPADIVISIICFAFLIVLKEIINTRFAHKLKAPIPAELLLVVIATLISYFCKLNERFDVGIIGHIPKGIPAPAVPSMHRAQDYVMDSFLIAIISFVVSVSMAKLLARKHSYQIDQNQEMFAIGMSFSISAFFSCFGGTQAPPRSLVQSSAGGKTQLASIFSSLLVLLVCLLLAPAFQPLPKSVLACIIIVALFPLFKQFAELKNYWNVNRYDFFTWVVTWFCATVLSITLGLAIGLLFSLLTIVMDAFVAPAFKMESVQADIYRPEGLHDSSLGKTTDRIRIIRFEAPLFFANLDQFKSKLFEKSGINLKAAKQDQTAAKKQEAATDAVVENGDKEESVHLKEMDNNANRSSNGAEVLIIDCSVVSYIDLQGLTMLKQLEGDLKKAGVRLVMAGCSDRLLDKLTRMGLTDLLQNNTYVTVHDAVTSLS